MNGVERGRPTHDNPPTLNAWIQNRARSKRRSAASASRSPRGRPGMSRPWKIATAGGHVRAGRDPPAALRRHGASRRGRNDRDAAARGRRQGAGRRGRVSGASRSHQGTGSRDGGGRRLRFALAIRDRSSLGEPDQDGGIYAPCRAATARSRHPGCITSAITAASRISTRRSTASSSMAWSTGPSNTRSPISSASQLCRVPISWSVPARPAARS